MEETTLNYCRLPAGLSLGQAGSGGPTKVLFGISFPLGGMKEAHPKNTAQCK